MNYPRRIVQFEAIRKLLKIGKAEIQRKISKGWAGGHGGGPIRIIKDDIPKSTISQDKPVEVEQKVECRVTDNGQVCKALPVLNPAIRPGP